MGYYFTVFHYHLSNFLRVIYSALSSIFYYAYYFVFFTIFKDPEEEKPDKFKQKYGILTTTKDPHTPSIKARVLNVLDGDTIRVKTQAGEVFNVRTFGVDAPELDQPYGVEARKFLNHLISMRKVELVQCKGSSYKRKVCYVFYNNHCINEIMLREGLVWHEPNYAPNLHHYATIQRNCKNRQYVYAIQN